MYLRNMMHPTRAWAVGVLATLVSLACQGPFEGDAPAGSETVVAVVDERPITLRELDDWIRDDLYRREVAGRNAAQLFKLRETALQHMIDEQLLAAEARRRNLEPSELVAEEIAALGPVSDEEVASFYAERADRFGDATLEDLAPRIREYLEQARAHQVLAQLREDARVTLHLDPPRVEVGSDGPSLGPADAAVTIVEFSDFQCPFCKRALPILRELRERYPDDVRIVYRHFPIESIHPHAREAAEASLCADDQGGFWPFHDRLFQSPEALATEDLQRYAAELELDTNRFGQCLTERPHREHVAADAAAGEAAGVVGTPAFFVNGIFVEGAQPIGVFVELIDAELARQATEGS
jgi:protein-disulfide isomerase